MPHFDKTALCHDLLVLETVKGAVELLSKPVQTLSRTQIAITEATASTLAIDYEGTIESLEQLRLYSTCSVLLAPLQSSSMPLLAIIEKRIDESLAQGLLKAFYTDEGPLRFRISPLRYGRWEIRDFLQEHYGWLNEPGAWDINLEACGNNLVAQAGPLYYTKRFPALQRIPASTNPVVANVMITLLDVVPGQVVYDPFCGAGTLLVEVLASVPKTRVVGSDSSASALKLARQNLASYRGRWSLRQKDATALSVADASVERLVANLPFGKRVGSHRQNQNLYPAFASELARMLAPAGLAVLLTEEKQLLRRAISETGSLAVKEEYMLEVGGLHPCVFLIAKKHTCSRKQSFSI